MESACKAPLLISLDRLDRHEPSAEGKPSWRPTVILVTPCDRDGVERNFPSFSLSVCFSPYEVIHSLETPFLGNAIVRCESAAMPEGEGVVSASVGLVYF